MRNVVLTLVLSSVGVLYATSVHAQGDSTASCEPIKDSKRRAACFETVARRLTAEKKPKDDIAPFVVRAKKEVAKDFLDPDSANFRGLFVLKDNTGSSLCGEVNAKNKMGAYVGYRRFVMPFKSDENAFSNVAFEDPAPQTDIDRAKAKLFGITWDVYCTTSPAVWRE
jgi:hypothetical protein